MLSIPATMPFIGFWINLSVGGSKLNLHFPCVSKTCGATWLKNKTMQNDDADFGQMPEMHRNAENPILLSFLIMYFFKDRYWWYIFVVVLVMPSCNMKHGTEEFCLQKQDSCWGPAFTYQSTFRVNSKMNPGSISNQRQFDFLMGIFYVVLFFGPLQSTQGFP